MTIYWKAVEQYFTVVLFVFFNYSHFVILGLALSVVKGLKLLANYLICVKCQLIISLESNSLDNVILNTNAQWKVIRIKANSVDAITTAPRLFYNNNAETRKENLSVDTEY